MTTKSSTGKGPSAGPVTACYSIGGRAAATDLSYPGASGLSLGGNVTRPGCQVTIMRKRWGLLSVIVFVAVVAVAAWLDTTPPGADENQRGWEAQQKKDYATALEWYDKATALGDAHAENNLGWLYEHGLGVEQDYAQALEWYGKAAARGDVGAEVNLAWLYRDGQGVQQDYGQAMAWYRKAAEQGNAIAEANVGMLYLDGEGVRARLRASHDLAPQSGRPREWGSREQYRLAL